MSQLLGFRVRSIVTPRSFLAVAGGLVLASLAACATAPASTSLPEEYLGRWYYVGSSGGITGRGMGDKGTGYVVLHGNNTMDHHEEDGVKVRTTAFAAGRGPTIFSTEDQWILNLDGGPAEVIRLGDNGRTMTLSQNVYDGFSREYVRSR